MALQREKSQEEEKAAEAEVVQDQIKQDGVDRQFAEENERENAQLEDTVEELKEII